MRLGVWVTVARLGCAIPPPACHTTGHILATTGDAGVGSGRAFLAMQGFLAVLGARPLSDTSPPQELSDFTKLHLISTLSQPSRPQHAGQGL